ncbi:MAG: hypothetical protein J6V38_08060 [Kiritimatiellae bacterium]|nr:hypothetical protein [Kiritimatiellia bacterium]
MKKLMLIALVAVCGCGQSSCTASKEFYIDMPAKGWWITGQSEDGYKLYKNGNITIKTLERVK